MPARTDTRVQRYDCNAMTAFCGDALFLASFTDLQMVHSVEASSCPCHSPTQIWRTQHALRLSTTHTVLRNTTYRMPVASCEKIISSKARWSTRRSISTASMFCRQLCGCIRRLSILLKRSHSDGLVGVCLTSSAVPVKPSQRLLPRCRLMSTSACMHTPWCRGRALLPATSRSLSHITSSISALRPMASECVVGPSVRLRSSSPSFSPESMLSTALRQRRPLFLTHSAAGAPGSVLRFLGNRFTQHIAVAASCRHAALCFCAASWTVATSLFFLACLA